MFVRACVYIYVYVDVWLCVCVTQFFSLICILRDLVPGKGNFSLSTLLTVGERLDSVQSRKKISFIRKNGRTETVVSKIIRLPRT